MKIILAKNMGMCFGVKRALDIAKKTLEMKKQGKIYTYGPLVHNKEVIYVLEKKGIRVASSIDNVEKCDVLVIRAHGVSDMEIADARKKDIKVVDATCPFVEKAKQAAKDMEKQGFKIVILGQKEHPEVIGIAESLQKPVIISGAEEVKDLEKYEKIGLVSQTTQSEKTFNEVVNELKKLKSNVKIEKTICNATSERQKTAKETASKSDIMVVVGDKSSANTKKLVEICSGITETKHIEKASELERGWFEGKNTVGITAGASTPDWIIDDVVKTLKGY